jgi:hypothetical protein
MNRVVEMLTVEQCVAADEARPEWSLAAERSVGPTKRQGGRAQGMKYKRIDSALHNFAHSFLSFNNYVDDEFVLDELHSTLRSSGDVVINFSTGAVEPTAAATPRVRRSLEYWQAGLGDHLRSQQVDPDRVRDVLLHLRLTRQGYEHTVEATDDRGTMHRVAVKPAS